MCLIATYCFDCCFFFFSLITFLLLDLLVLSRGECVLLPTVFGLSCCHQSPSPVLVDAAS